ncbi:hypothetical protein TGFOU_402820, partial [Toxoplasma gondii FOU]
SSSSSSSSSFSFSSSVPSTLSGAAAAASVIAAAAAEAASGRARRDEGATELVEDSDDDDFDEPYTPLVVILALPSTDPQTVSAAADLFNSFSPLPASVIQSAMAPYLRQAAARAGSPGAGDAGSFVISAAREESETGIASAREGLPAQAPPDAPAPSAGGACRDSSATSLTEGDRRGDREETEERREAPVSPPASAPPRTDEEIAAAVAVEMLAEESVALASEPSIAAATLWGMTQAAALNLSPIAAFHLESKASSTCIRIGEETRREDLSHLPATALLEDLLHAPLTREASNRDKQYLLSPTIFYTQATA